MILKKSATQKKPSAGNPKAVWEVAIQAAHNAITNVWPDYCANQMPSLESYILPHKYYESNQTCWYFPSRQTTLTLLLWGPRPQWKTKECHFGHVNLVHCLSYGEPWMLESPKLQKDKTMMDGTRQFWKLFSVLAGEQDIHENRQDPLDIGFNRSVQEDDTLLLFRKLFSHIERPRSQSRKVQVAARERRLHAKKNVLNMMRDCGILMADRFLGKVNFSDGARLLGGCLFK